MLDIEFIAQNQKAVEKGIRDRGGEVDLDELLTLDKDRRQLLGEVEKLRQARNELSDSLKEGKPSQQDIARGKELKADIAELEGKLEEVERKQHRLLNAIPNIPAEDVPVGPDESANKPIRKWGEKPEFDFEPKAHWELGETQGLIDLERAAKVSGSRFTYIKGGLVQLQFALAQLVLDTITNEATLTEIIKANKLTVLSKPFTPVITPVLVRDEVMAKTGRLDPVEDKYFLADDKQFLAGTAEQTLAPMHMDEILQSDDLPLRYVGYSTCFRREAGSWGKDVRGILRQHQFDKFEMESFTTADTGEEEQQLIVAIQEHLMQLLELPYRVVAISTGDMGKPDVRQFDIEVWLPSQRQYRETHTADYVGDYQARRLNIRYKDSSGATRFVHMNDGTAFAMGRTMLAIMENYQTKDGKIGVPKVLQPYLKEEYL